LLAWTRSASSSGHDVIGYPNEKLTRLAVEGTANFLPDFTTRDIERIIYESVCSYSGQPSVLPEAIFRDPFLFKGMGNKVFHGHAKNAITNML
jgi:hypothetical protein